MYSFFILGQIPGTNITISFTMWAQLCAVLLLAVLVIRFRRHQAAERLEPTIGNE
jgi:hypothetical protein